MHPLDFINILDSVGDLVDVGVTVAAPEASDITGGGVFGMVMASAGVWISTFVIELLIWFYELMNSWTQPAVGQSWVTTWYSRLLGLGFMFAAVAFFAQLIRTLMTRKKLHGLARAFFGSLAVGVLGPSLLTFVDYVVALQDELNQALIVIIGEDMHDLKDSLVELSLTTASAAKSSVFLVGLLLIAGIVSMALGALLFMVMIGRSLLVSLLAVAGSIVIAGLVFEKTRSWASRWATGIITVTMMPLFVTIIFGMSAGMILAAVRQPLDGTGADPATVVMPTVIVMAGMAFGAALFVPWKIFTFVSSMFGVSDPGVSTDMDSANVAKSSWQGAKNTKNSISSFLSKASVAGGAGAAAGVAGLAADKAAKGASKAKGSFDKSVMDDAEQARGSLPRRTETDSSQSTSPSDSSGEPQSAGKSSQTNMGNDTPGTSSHQNERPQEQHANPSASVPRTDHPTSESVRPQEPGSPPKTSSPRTETPTSKPPRPQDVSPQTPPPRPDSGPTQKPRTAGQPPVDKPNIPPEPKPYSGDNTKK